MATETSSTDVAARLRDTARRAPDRVALRWQHRVVTYGELDARVDRAVAALQHLGVEPGDRVAIALGNVPAFVEAHFATLRAGATVVPLNSGLTSDEFRHALADSGASVAVVMPAVADLFLALRDELDTLHHVVVAGADAAVGIDASRWRDLLDAGYPVTTVERAPGDLAALVYTSGTTGRPRGAMLTRANLGANQDQCARGPLPGRGGRHRPAGAAPVPHLRPQRGARHLRPCRRHDAPGRALRPGGLASRRSASTASRSSSAPRRCTSPG